MNIFNLDEELKCLEIEGNWIKTKDTLRLSISENKNYYYLITTDGRLKSPNNDVFHLIMTNQEDQVVNKGIDNFGIGISEMKPVNKLLLYSGDKTKEKILKWITTHCN